MLNGKNLKSIKLCVIRGCPYDFTTLMAQA